jgi:hypothetical protein
MSDKKSVESPTPDEIGAMRFAYKIMQEEYPGRYISETDKRELAVSVIKALGNAKSLQNENIILMVMVS